METRKKIFGAECLFTALIAVYEVVTVLALFTDLFSGITIKQNILFSQSLIFVPTVLYLFIMRKHVKDIIWFRRFHPLTLLLIPPLVLFMEPLITLLNAISMLFVRNEISNAASALVDHNTLGTSLFFMAFLPCVIEELAYRGVMFGSFHEAGRLKAILMSGFLFGLMHMNFNQMAYAVVIGLIFGFVVEATGSIIHYSNNDHAFSDQWFFCCYKAYCKYHSGVKRSGRKYRSNTDDAAQHHPGIYTYGTGWHCNISRNYLSACSHKWQKGELRRCIHRTF